MKAEKKVRISVTVPNKEGEKLRSFPYFASFIVSCLLEEFFKHVTVDELVKEINVGRDVNERLGKLRECISAVFLAPGRGRKGARTSQGGGTDRKTDFWEVLNNKD